MSSRSRDDEPDGNWIKETRQGKVQWRRADEEPQERGISSNSFYSNDTTQLLSDHFRGRGELSRMYQESSSDFEAITWKSPATEHDHEFMARQAAMYQMPDESSSSIDPSICTHPSHHGVSSYYSSTPTTRPNPYTSHTYDTSYGSWAEREEDVPPVPPLRPPRRFVQTYSDEEKEAPPPPPSPPPRFSSRISTTKSPDTSSTLSHSFQRLFVNSDKTSGTTPRVPDARWGDEPQGPLPSWEPTPKPKQPFVDSLPRFPSTTSTTSSPRQTGQPLSEREYKPRFGQSETSWTPGAQKVAHDRFHRINGGGEDEEFSERQKMGEQTRGSEDTVLSKSDRMDSPNLRDSSPLFSKAPPRPSTESRTHLDGSSHYFSHSRPSPRTSVGSSRSSNTDSMMDLTHLIIYPDAERFPKASGGYSDVYQADLEGRAVAVKVMKAKVRREPGVDHDRQHRHLVKKINREMKLWSRLAHPNVLSFLGFCFFKLPNESPAGDPGQLSLISPWMDNGTARQYVQKHPEADRPAITRGVAAGLHHLHKNQIIHGDIKSGNVLMTDNGVPVLADFGLATLAEDDSLGLTNEHVTTTTGTSHGTPRWMAPEFFQHDADSQKSTKETDVWAFGCFVLELFTLQVPYATSRTDLNAMAAIMQQRLPYECPTNQVPYPFVRYPELWHLCLCCWAFDPPSRITVPDILEFLRT
ncbi:kinase-like protein [Sistotremastrum suecicum HHB10207 ss-3]|uniref:Kinase-like protein n=1 Tax=Sistotremastrum suecicum HHB10207 ss-3 TaxID=1314776 RepID=A0A166BIJ3_9AGAM|nr:kinase-like protein [Sistotremastrum suecicum HHB10207 ss-3]